MIGKILFSLVLLAIASPTLATTVYIEPNKTSVVKGDFFALDISVQGSSAHIVLVNFSYDASKIVYIRNTTQKVFDFIDVLDAKWN
ncbi:MAG: hypothetical protein N3A69_13470, partial [Leptospiraceae bacterium]|nr:hypothetical protein [Leptospiraceae bacterium]